MCDQINTIMVCVTTVLYYKQSRWPTQVDLTIIITIMLFIIFCNKHRSKRPFRKVWNTKHSSKWLTHIRVTKSSCCLSWRYCIANIGVWVIITFTLGWYNQVITTPLSVMMVLNTTHRRTWVDDITDVTMLYVTIAQRDKHWGKWPT